MIYALLIIFLSPHLISASAPNSIPSPEMHHNFSLAGFNIKHHQGRMHITMQNKLASKTPEEISAALRTTLKHGYLSTTDKAFTSEYNRKVQAILSADPSAKIRPDFYSLFARPESVHPCPPHTPLPQGRLLNTPLHGCHIFANPQDPQEIIIDPATPLTLPKISFFFTDPTAKLEHPYFSLNFVINFTRLALTNNDDLTSLQHLYAAFNALAQKNRDIAHQEIANIQKISGLSHPLSTLTNKLLTLFGCIATPLWEMAAIKRLFAILTPLINNTPISAKEIHQLYQSFSKLFAHNEVPFVTDIMAHIDTASNFKHPHLKAQSPLSIACSDFTRNLDAEVECLQDNTSHIDRFLEEIHESFFSTAIFLSTGNSPLCTGRITDETYRLDQMQQKIKLHQAQLESQRLDCVIQTRSRMIAQLMLGNCCQYESFFWKFFLFGLPYEFVESTLGPHLVISKFAIGNCEIFYKSDNSQSLLKSGAHLHLRPQVPLLPSGSTTDAKKSATHQAVSRLFDIIRAEIHSGANLTISSRAIQEMLSFLDPNPHQHQGDAHTVNTLSESPSDLVTSEWLKFISETNWTQVVIQHNSQPHEFQSLVQNLDQLLDTLQAFKLTQANSSAPPIFLLSAIYARIIQNFQNISQEICPDLSDVLMRAQANAYSAPEPSFYTKRNKTLQDAQELLKNIAQTISLATE